MLAEPRPWASNTGIYEKQLGFKSELNLNVKKFTLNT